MQSRPARILPFFVVSARAAAVAIYDQVLSERDL